MTRRFLVSGVIALLCACQVGSGGAPDAGMGGLATHLGFSLPPGTALVHDTARPGHDGASSATAWLALREPPKRAGLSLAKANPGAAASSGGTLTLTDERGTTTADIFAAGADAVPPGVGTMLPPWARGVLRIHRQNRPPPCPPCVPGGHTMPGCSCPDPQPTAHGCTDPDDCVNSCSRGAVNKVWYASAFPTGDGCEDGCDSKSMGTPQCVDGTCVAVDRAGQRVDECTQKPVGATGER